MKKIFLFIATLSTLGTMATEGALSGKFSVAADKQVVFSQGNLQYQASTNTYRFATEQIDYIGADNANIADDYDGFIDLFGWGTGNNPTLSRMNDHDYQTFTDWGVNAISNGGNMANQWRTLTKDEWVYLFHDRTNAQNLFSLGTIRGIHGAILLPDNWTTPSGLVFDASTSNGLSWVSDGEYYYDTTKENHFRDNAYTFSEWCKMEAAGAVFLPAAGCYRDVNNVGLIGTYWSATPIYEAYAFGLWLDSYSFGSFLDCRYFGFSVRLVQDYDGSVIGIDNTSVSSKNVKRIINGQLLIERDGKIYNAQGVLMSE